MKIVLIPHTAHYRDWAGKTYFDIITHLSNNSKYEIEILWVDRKNNLHNYLKNPPDLIIFFSTDVLTNIAAPELLDKLFQIKCLKICSSLDLFYFDNCTKCPYIEKCDGILHFSHASKLLSSYKDYFPNFKIQSLSARFANTEKYKNYHLEKKYDILIYGSRPGNTFLENYKADQDYKEKWEQYHGKKIGVKHLFYPLRVRLENLLLKNQDKYKLKILPVKCIFNAEIVNEDLSKLINQSYLTMCTSSRADIAMSKYFEVGASYSGILGNIPTDYEDIFKENIIEVSEWMTDEEILKIIDNALSDKEKLMKKINYTGNLFHRKYNLEQSTIEIDNCINNFLK